MKLTGWWALPEEDQEAILAALPEQDEWSFVATRISDHAWSIDVPEAGTYGELLVGGTNKALDVHFNDLTDLVAENGDQVKLTCSIKQLEDTTTVLKKVKDDDSWSGSATFLELVFNQECWLCAFTNVLWGHTPEVIYLKIEPK